MYNNYTCCIVHQIYIAILGLYYNFQACGGQQCYSVTAYGSILGSLYSFQTQDSPQGLHNLAVNLKLHSSVTEFNCHLNGSSFQMQV